jgi:galactokinase
LGNASDAAVREHFARIFHREPQVVVSAPGRVNLIGEHTDYNGGYVLPMAIPQRTWVAISHAADHHARVSSRNLGGGDRIREFSVGGEVVTRSWIDYVQGVTQAMARDGHAVRGFDLAIVSDVPLGSGLSSSAALEIAENDFVGAPVGLMDQMAASLADDRTALFLDTRTLQYEQVPLPGGGGLVVINSGVAHNHASGDYRTRRAECERAAAALGVPQLRDLGPADLPRVAALPEPLDRRARHVVTEDERVLESVAAMKAGDLRRLGELFAASHASQRDDFEVSVREIDLLVDLASAEPGVFGARLTGGGFGGSIVALVEASASAGIGERVARAYRERSGHTPAILVPQTHPGL